MQSPLRKKLFKIIFEADTKSGKIFDVSLLIIIVISLVLVMLESVPQLNSDYKNLFIRLEWVFTIVFMLEYFVRIYTVAKRSGYIFSFFGIIDLLAILPAFLGLFISGAQSLLVIRAIRLLRVFRIFKINRYSNASRMLVGALVASREKISVFLFAVVTVIIIVGTAMYLIEGEVNGFTSIPKSIYWAIVTITTVGYGDLTPQTTLGQIVSSLLMIMGYAIIAVPTGIISVELIRSKEKKELTRVCPQCLKEGHNENALFCSSCGTTLGK